MVYSILSSSQLWSQFWWQNWEMKLKESDWNVNSTKAAHRVQLLQRLCGSAARQLAPANCSWLKSRELKSFRQAGLTNSSKPMGAGVGICACFPVPAQRSQIGFIAVKFAAWTGGRVRPPRTQISDSLSSHSFTWIDIYVKFMSTSEKTICEGWSTFCNPRAARVTNEQFSSQKRWQQQSHEHVGGSADEIIQRQIITSVIRGLVICPDYHTAHVHSSAFCQYISLFHPPVPPLSPSAPPLTLTVSKWPINFLHFGQNGLIKNYVAELAGLLICKWWFLSIYWPLRAPMARYLQVICMLMPQRHLVHLGASWKDMQKWKWTTQTEEWKRLDFFLS